MNANRVTVVLLVVVLGLVGIDLLRQSEINAELRADLRRLQPGGGDRPVVPSDRGPAGSTAPTPEQLAALERVELTRMRKDNTLLKARTEELAQLAIRNVDGVAPLNLVPAAAWKNAGKDTPTAAIESLMWATDGGDLDALANAVVLDADAREKAAAILSRLPEATRAAYGTPERLVALFLAQDGDISAMQVLAEHKAGINALVSVRLQKGDGKTKDEGYQFRQTDDGWRLVVPGKAVDKFGKKLSDPKKK
ncbi:MAG: hypothetical protein EXS32_14210 [Opitutus sp.]|nr:hypothetical protein [Opitutus sp.]